MTLSLRNRSFHYSKDSSVSYRMKSEVKRFFTSSRLSHVALFLLVVFLLVHYFTDHLSNLPSNGLQLEPDTPYSSYKLRDLKHIDELNRIKRSVSNELRELESKRNQLQDDISFQQNALSNIEQTVKKTQSQLDTLKRQIVQLKNEQREVSKPKMMPPARLIASEKDNVLLSPPKDYSQLESSQKISEQINEMNYSCEMHDCFDYSRCSLTSQFPVYIYPFEDGSPFSVTQYIIDATTYAFSSSRYVTSDPNAACLFVVVLGEIEASVSANSQPLVEPSIIADWLQSLSHWNGDGRNHLLVYLHRRAALQNPLLGVDVGRAFVAQSNFAKGQFRPGFDIVMPTLALIGLGHSAGLEQELDRINVDEWKKEDETWAFEHIPLQVPALREYFVSFQGHWDASDHDYAFEQEDRNEKPLHSAFHDLFVENLKALQTSKLNGKYRIHTKCPDDRPVVSGYRSEWSLCGTFSTRSAILSHSTFVLLPVPSGNVVTTPLFVTRLAEAIRSGAVPVIIGTQAVLPFGEFINWEKAAVIIPQARVTELSFLLSNLPHAEILSLRRQGRFIFNTYFSSHLIIESMLAVVRTRILIPALPVTDVASDVVDHKSYKIEEHEPAPGDAQSEFGFPPSEPQINSPTFKRNFSSVLFDAQDTWNNAPGPFNLYPNLPTDRTLPTDAQFIGSSEGFRPIGGGEGGSGRVYQESLGGNQPREQYTIVMLTYEREDVLIQAVERLADLPHLNKVVVVWNSPTTPGDNLKWPDIGVEVVVIQAERNSLNNRFKPWDAIETEAVLSIDDDAHLRHDEILFGFRVWRECRHRIVGFPGRFHAWNENSGGWAYNSNYTCELSMVLTGAAFFHKHYMYLYTYWMPAAIRETVDEYMNCEDIAMNFLVSHLTRLPPVKVTSRWTFRCPGCPAALSQSDEHFQERHKCINKFVKVFGYMPLIYTQFRVDSILFKTRLPHDRNKCFKFI